tara:strand:+ start:6053 stop:6499 length:447 start_codon:yes stop_codon:yes gene_type:complete
MHTSRWLSPLLLCLGLTSAPSALAVTAQATTSPQTPRERVLAFVKMAFQEKHLAPAFERYIAEDYIQHSPGIGNGRAATLKALSAFQQQFPDMEYQLLHIAAEQDLVFLHVKGKMNADDPGAYIVDIFRVENGWITEHWDVIQAISKP